MKFKNLYIIKKNKKIKIKIKIKKRLNKTKQAQMCSGNILK